MYPGIQHPSPHGVSTAVHISSKQVPLAEQAAERQQPAIPGQGSVSAGQHPPGEVGMHGPSGQQVLSEHIWKQDWRAKKRERRGTAAAIWTRRRRVDDTPLR